MTGRELVTGALEVLHVMAAGETLSAPNAATGLAVANRMVKAWKWLALYEKVRSTYTWTASQSSRTIASTGANLTGDRPDEILIAKVIPVGSDHEQPVHLMTEGEYAAISNKAQTADYFTHLRYRKSSPLGTLIVWPVPTSAPTLVLHTRAPITTIELGSDIDVSGEYEECLVYQLALRLADSVDGRLTDDARVIARDALALVKKGNIEVPDPVRLPSEFRGRRGSISQADFDGGRF